MKIQVKKLADKLLATCREVDGKEYFCLAEILEQLGLKGGFNEKQNPLTITGTFIWGFRADSLNLLETVFIDGESALKLIKEEIQRRN